MEYVLKETEGMDISRAVALSKNLTIDIHRNSLLHTLTSATSTVWGP